MGREKITRHTTSLSTDISICFLLISAITAVYWQVGLHEFVTFDDPSYVTENSMVRNGITLRGIQWAFFTTHYYNWHPLTWISHMLDCTMFGLDPAGHHIVNVVFHGLNTLLLFFILKAMTGSHVKSAFVAAFFSLHPLHVETVAWIAERKDVLSTFFLMLTVGSYLRYVESKNPKSYLITITVFILGLMSKPMLVTLPFILLLLDYWPLNRFQLKGANKTQDVSVIVSLVREKVPFFICSAASCVITVIAQQKIVKTFAAYPFDVRIYNAIMSYVGYLWKAFWPRDLAVFYPHTADKLGIWSTLTAALLLVCITFLSLRYWRKGYLLVGWLWYVGTLVPVIGFVQVGLQSMADRYTYIPLIGIFIMVAWGLDDMLKNVRQRKAILGITGVVVLAALMVATTSQLHHWENSLKLYQRAVDATTDNDWAHYNLGLVLLGMSKDDLALNHFQESLRINPNNPETITNMGIVFAKKGELEKAIALFEKAVYLQNDYFQARYNLGLAYSKKGDSEKALSHLYEAMRIDPGDSGANFLLGMELANQGQYDKAITHLAKVIEANPQNASAHNAIGVLFGRQGHIEKAVNHFREAVRLNPGFLEAKKNLEEAATAIQRRP